MEAFEQLRLWIDPLERPGPESMAVDEWLLETSTTPVLRVYRWLGEWGSVGYFGSLAAAMSLFPGISWVRRWTGGGTVDHRTDWTYTVIAPVAEALAGCRGAESYRILHAALAASLVEEGIDARLSTGTEETGATLCFENPVSHDLVGPGGLKLAGAGQRRTRSGLLHQGSVAAPANPSISTKRAELFAGCLAKQWTAICLEPPTELMARKIDQRYGRQAWTGRR
jgi:lipoate-protein ligase A